MDKEVNELTIEDLPEPYRGYAACIGIDNLFRLSELVGGKNIYIPIPDSIILLANKKKIVREYKSGVSVKKLAEQYNVSTDTIYRYIKNHR